MAIVNVCTTRTWSAVSSRTNLTGHFELTMLASAEKDKSKSESLARPTRRPVPSIAPADCTVRL